MQRKGHFTARHAFLSFHVLTAAGSHTSVTNELAPSHQQPFFFLQTKEGSLSRTEAFQM